MTNNNNENPVKILLEREKCFKVILSTKTEVKCDKNEIQRVIEGITNGGIIKLKQGLINPSFIVAVIEDEERRTRFVEEVNSIAQNNHQDREYHGGKNQRQLPSGIKPLKDILNGIQLKRNPDVKELSDGQK